MIAMALSCSPKLLIADEPTTALDVTIQAQIMQLMGKIREETGTAIILITHDLGVVANLADRVAVIEGGSTRNETIMNAIRYIENEGNLNDDTIIVTHDSVRPFVTYRIIEENIAAAEQFGACDTVIPATDTIVESRDHQVISAIPDRSVMYQGQTPQSFRATKLKKLYETLTEEEKEILTDAAKIFVIKGEPVALVQGETYNMKITYPYDLRVAKSLLEDETHD